MKLPRTLPGEAALLAALVLVITLLANSLHPNGLDLTRNYFPKAIPDSNPDSIDPGVKQSSLPAHDFTVLSLDDMIAWQPYALEADGGVILLDARNAKTYAVGHIPGARLCDHYHQDRYVPALLEAMNKADMVIIYCAGGECEDSIQLATDLVYHHGLSKELLAIFEGGYEQWTQANLKTVEGE
jgi:rhodanese-related sulfurtransferase